MFKKILFAVIACLIVTSIVVTFQPDEFLVSRTVSIQAPIDQVFNQVNVTKNWGYWSPWEKLDPHMIRTYEGPEAGVGSIYRWSGNSNVGKGQSTLIESNAPALIRYRLEFFEPFAATNESKFSFERRENETIVNWEMSGKKNFLAKAIGLFMDCEQMVGANFEEGLNTLKKVVETSR